MIKLNRDVRDWFYILVQKASSKSSDFHTWMEILKSLLENEVVINSFSDDILFELPTIRYNNQYKTYSIVYHRNSILEPKYQMLVVCLVIMAHDRDRNGTVLEEYCACSDMDDLKANNPELFSFWPPSV